MEEDEKKKLQMKLIKSILLHVAGHSQTAATEIKEKGDVVHPLYKMIAEGDAKGITDLFEKSDNPKLILTNLVPLSKVPAKIEKRANLMKIEFVAPFHAAIMCYNADVLQVLVDKALELRIFPEATEGRDLHAGEQKREGMSSSRPLYFALANCWYRGADILFKAGSGLFSGGDNNPILGMILFLRMIIFKTDDVVALQWLLKHGLGTAFGPSHARVSLFHMAACEGALRCMQLILPEAIQNSKEKTKAAVVDEVFQGSTPLVYALRDNQHDVVRWLLMHGAHKDLDKALGLTGVGDHCKDIIRETRQAYLDSLLDDT